MRKSFYLFMAGILGMGALASCSEDEPSEGILNKVRAVDITVVVSLHPSSLEYFDYVVRYQDNQGLEQTDTINGETALDSRYSYVTTLSYTSQYVVAVTTVELVPKCPKDSLVSFSFITPKPYIYSQVYSDSSLPTGDNNGMMGEGLEVIRIDNMSVGDFLSTYGSSFTSHCIVKEEE